MHLCPLHVHTSKKHSSLSSICALLDLGAPQPCGSLPSTWIASHCFTRFRSQLRLSSRDPQDSTKRVQSPRSIGLWFASYNCACCSRSPSASAPMRHLLTRLRPTPKSVSCAAHFMSCSEKCSPAPVARPPFSELPFHLRCDFTSCVWNTCQSSVTVFGNTVTATHDSHTELVCHLH